MARQVVVTPEQKEIARMLGLKPEQVASRTVFNNADIASSSGGYTSFSTRAMRERSQKLALHQSLRDDDVDGLLANLADDIKTALDLRKQQAANPGGQGTGARLDAVALGIFSGARQLVIAAGGDDPMASDSQHFSKG